MQEFKMQEFKMQYRSYAVDDHNHETPSRPEKKNVNPKRKREPAKEPPRRHEFTIRQDFIISRLRFGLTLGCRRPSWILALSITNRVTPISFLNLEYFES